MKSIVIEQFGDVSVLQERETPLPTPSRREVRIRIRAAGFNPVDTKIRAGAYGGKFPLILGADCSGVIDAVGDPNCEFSVGDEVCALIFGQGSNGAYAEYACVPTAFVVKKPKSLTFEQAAAVPLVGITAFQALIASGALQEGGSLFIPAGAGGVGSFAIPLARLYKVGQIVTTAGNEESADYLMRELAIPEKQILFYKGLNLEQMEARALELNGKRPFATAFDTIGGEMKKLSLRVVDYYGHVATILMEPKGFECDLWMRGESIAFNKCLSIHFIFIGAAARSPHERDWKVYQVQLKSLMQLIERGELPAPKVEVVGTLSAETVRAAHLKLEDKRTRGKLVMSV